MMTIKKIDRYDLLNTPKDKKPAVTVWFTGCSRRCDGCHNPSLWEDCGQQYTPNGVLFSLCTILEKYQLDTVVLMGGEPMEQDISNLRIIIDRLSAYGYKIWMYTGFEFEDIPDNIKKNLYTIKCGYYDISLDQQPKFPASSNQRVYRKIDGQWQQIDLN